MRTSNLVICSVLEAKLELAQYIDEELGEVKCDVKADDVLLSMKRCQASILMLFSVAVSG